MDFKEYAKIFKALSDQNRIQILLILSQKETCACKFYEALGVTQQVASRHLKALYDAQLIIGRKEGKGIYYSLNKEMIAEMQLFLDFLDLGDMQCACHEGN
jgi:ArsR family transcriptional regulator